MYEFKDKLLLFLLLEHQLLIIDESIKEIEILENQILQLTDDYYGKKRLE
jgi:hypothetical protein